MYIHIIHMHFEIQHLYVLVLYVSVYMYVLFHLFIGLLMLYMCISLYIVYTHIHFEVQHL